MKGTSPDRERGAPFVSGVKEEDEGMQPSVWRGQRLALGSDVRPHTHPQ